MKIYRYQEPRVQWLRIYLPMQETEEMRVRSLSQEDALAGEMPTHSSILAWEISRTEEHGGYSPWGAKEADVPEHARTA